MKEFLLSSYLNKYYSSYLTKVSYKFIKEFDTTILDSCELAVNIYRIQHELFKMNLNKLPIQKILSSLQKSLCCCEIYYSSIIGKNFLLCHGLGTVIGSGVEIGDNCTIYHNVTLGTKYDTSKEKCKIANNVIIYTGAQILGDIFVGNNAVIAANSVVINDVFENEIYAGVPAKKIGIVNSNKYKLSPGIK